MYMSITIKHQIKLIMQYTIINNIKEIIQCKAVHSIENDSDSVILLLGLAQISFTTQWEITPIVQCWNSY